MAMTLTQIVTVLFGAYGESKDINRQMIYCKVLKDIPPALLETAVYKVLGEWEKSYLPPPAVVIKAAKSLTESTDDTKRKKTWTEALAEVEQKMLATPWGKTPEWSTLEIAQAVNAIGWQNLQTTLAKDMPIVRAQLRKLYEDACERTTEEARNAYLRGKNPLGVLGIGQEQKSVPGEAVEALAGIEKCLTWQEKE